MSQTAEVWKSNPRLKQVRHQNVCEHQRGRIEVRVVKPLGGISGAPGSWVLHVSVQKGFSERQSDT